MSDVSTKVKDNHEAFYNELFIENYDYIRAFVKRKISDNIESYDVTQETFLEAWKLIDRLYEHPEVRGWLIETAKIKLKRLFSDNIRTNNVISALQQQPIGVSWEKRLDLDFLSGLKQKELDIIKLYYIQEKSVAEVAAILGISEAAVKMRMSRARKTLMMHARKKNVLKIIFFFCYLLSIFAASIL